jgi:protein gp37
MAKRYGWAKWGHGEIRRFAATSTWKQTLAWNRKAERDGVRRRVFCSHLSDVFDAEVDDEWRVCLIERIHETPWLDWLLLTKRPKVAAEFFDVVGVPSNVWMGTTVENQAMADLRIPILLSIPARVRFLSCEPLLGQVDLRVVHDSKRDQEGAAFHINALTGMADRNGHAYIASLDLSQRPVVKSRIDWVIAGGESGPKARPTHLDWARSLRDQCAAAGTPFFWKQWGEWLPTSTLSIEQRAGREEVAVLPDGKVREWQPDFPGARLTSPEMTAMTRVGKKAAGALLDGREHREFPR